MSLTLSQIQSWNPSTLTVIGDAWLSVGSGIEGAFDRYKSAVTNINDGHWEGVAAEAALHRADSDRRAAARLADRLERVAKIAKDGFHAISPPLQRARDAIAGAERAGFTVSENLAVSRTGAVTPEQLRAKLQWQTKITDAAKDTESADNDVKRRLNAARADLRAAFISPVGLGSDQARTDARQLLGDPSHLSPEQVMRLAEAGSLTSEQLRALQSGDIVDIPASQMEYINTLARSLDGKSPQDIESMLSQLPPEARQGAANALQLLSTEKVTASVRGDAEIPTKGATSLLPQQMYQSLTRDDLATKKWLNPADFDPEDLAAGGLTSVGWEVTELNGVADNQAIARIADMSSVDVKHGTGLDTAIMDAATTYLDAQVTAEHSDKSILSIDGSLVRGAVDEVTQVPLTEDMFSAVADDKAVVSEAVSGESGEDLLGDVFTHAWPDKGETVSQLFDISAEDAVPTPGDRPDEVRAEQSGDIAESVADYMSDPDHKDNLVRLADDTKMSVGERNPELLRNLADDLAPYYSTFAGSDSIPGVGHFDSKGELANMYAVLATDPEAGVTAAQATYAQELALAYAYGHSDGAMPATEALIPAQMQYALETGTADAAQTLDEKDDYEARWKEAADKADWAAGQKAVSSIVGLIPGGGALNAAINVGDALTPDVANIVDPAAERDPTNNDAYQESRRVFNQHTIAEHMLNGQAAIDPTILNDPLSRELKATDPWLGETYFDMRDESGDLETGDLADAKKLLESRGVPVEDWFAEFNTSMHDGEEITVSDWRERR
jgi:hypothetical protein